ncbi:hypothetical protein [Azospirillum palustre]|nr:hypothetical protein [Azospirillum palustre]
MAGIRIGGDPAPRPSMSIDRRPQGSPGHQGVVGMIGRIVAVRVSSRAVTAIPVIIVAVAAISAGIRPGWSPFHLTERWHGVACEGHDADSHHQGGEQAQQGWQERGGHRDLGRGGETGAG